MPTDFHFQNAAERAICTSKAHFITILVRVDGAFPRYLCYTLLPQTKLTLNLLCQATLALNISAWEYYNGPVNYDTTPFVPIGCKVAILNKPEHANHGTSVPVTGSALAWPSPTTNVTRS